MYHLLFRRLIRFETTCTRTLTSLTKRQSIYVTNNHGLACVNYNPPLSTGVHGHPYSTSGKEYKFNFLYNHSKVLARVNSKPDSTAPVTSKPSRHFRHNSALRYLVALGNAVNNHDFNTVAKIVVDLTNGIRRGDIVIKEKSLATLQFNLVIRSLVHAKRLKWAMRIFNQMGSLSIKSNSDTIDLLVQLLAKSASSTTETEMLKELHKYAKEIMPVLVSGNIQISQQNLSVLKRFLKGTLCNSL